MLTWSAIRGGHVRYVFRWNCAHTCGCRSWRLRYVSCVVCNIGNFGKQPKKQPTSTKLISKNVSTEVILNWFTTFISAITLAISSQSRLRLHKYVCSPHNSILKSQLTLSLFLLSEQSMPIAAGFNAFHTKAFSNERFLSYTFHNNPIVRTSNKQVLTIVRQLCLAVFNCIAQTDDCHARKMEFNGSSLLTHALSHNFENYDVNHVECDFFWYTSSVMLSHPLVRFKWL